MSPIDADKLNVALGATKPLPVELLASSYQRRLPAPAEEIDPHLAVDDPPQRRSDREAARVLEILDEMERGAG